jgi:predicted ATPase
VIQQIHVRNFKAFKDQRFRLAPLTLLAGLNGSGKSSLLQTILILRQSFDQGLLSRNRVLLNGDLVHLGRFQDVLFESATDEDIVIGMEFEDGLKAGWTFQFSSREDRTAEVGPQLVPLEEFSVFRDGFRFLAAERIGPRIFYGVPEQRNSPRGLGIQGEWTTYFISQNATAKINNENCAHPEARSLQLQHQIEAWMGEISPGIQLHLESRPNLDLVQVEYSFIARRDTSSRYRPTNVGFGVSYTLPIVTAVLAAQPGDLLLLESPEAHLHPRGQAKLAELFCSAAAAGVQLIVESHSDHIMNGIRVGVHDGVLSAIHTMFFYFRWNASEPTSGTNVTPIQLDEDGRIKSWPEGFFDEFDKSLEALLTPSEKSEK